MEKPVNEQDRHLLTPQEANRDKNINFTAIETDDIDPFNERESGALTQSRFKEKVVEKENANKAKGNAGIGSDDEAH